MEHVHLDDPDPDFDVQVEKKIETVYTLNEQTVVVSVPKENNDMSLPHFKIADPEDIDYIFDSLKAMAQEGGYPDFFRVSKEMLTEQIFRQKLADVILAKKDNQYVGLAVFSLTNRHFTYFVQPGIYVHDIFVDPEHRRQKIGMYIVEEVIRIAKERGCGRVDLVVLRSNEMGLRFWEKVPHIVELKSLKYMRIDLQ
jgi:GNAT superfamily N-acetyltransferase